MTENKPIIINGIDVSRCPSYKHNGECENTAVWADYCKACSNCVYKLEQQLTRKTQECEELKRDNSTLFDKAMETRKENIELQVQLDELNAENEQLKANSTEWKTFDVSFHDGFVKTQISDMSLAEYSQLKLEKQQAEQKLEQIRDIASNYKNCNDLGFYVQNSEARYALWKVAQAMCNILQIIDEVE